MIQQKRTLFLYCEESLHAGAGSSTGTIDLPIQRERHTNYPMIESSSLRGAIRESGWDYINDNNGDTAMFNRVFGNKDNGNIHSAVDFTDARILFFPVRSYKGVFAWITSPLVLNRLQRDFQKMYNIDLPITIPQLPTDDEIIIQDSSDIVFDNEVVLEEYLFNARKTLVKINDMEMGEWMAANFENANMIIKKLKSNIAIVSDDVFRDFVELYTHKITRNKIDSNTGTAEGTGLFNEEFLPPESILYSFITTSDEFAKDNRLESGTIMCFVEDNLPLLFRGGGDKGIGKGLLRRSIVNFESNQTNTKTE